MVVELRDFGRCRLAAILAYEPHRYARTLLRKNLQRDCIRIRVNEYNLRLRAFNQARYIPHRVKLRLCGQDSIWKKVATVERIEHRINPLVRFELLNFNGTHALKKPCMVISKSAHGSKRSHDANIYRNGNRRSQYTTQHCNAVFRKGIGPISRPI